MKNKQEIVCKNEISNLDWRNSLQSSPAASICQILITASDKQARN